MLFVQYKIQLFFKTYRISFSLVYLTTCITIRYKIILHMYFYYFKKFKICHISYSFYGTIGTGSGTAGICGISTPAPITNIATLITGTIIFYPSLVMCLYFTTKFAFLQKIRDGIINNFF